MNRKFALKALFCALLLGAFTLPAQAAVVVGETCDQLGTSVMTTDQKDIATCLKDDSGKTVWKAMTGGGEDGMWCGFMQIRQVLRSGGKDGGGGIPGIYVLGEVLCKSQSIMVCAGGFANVVGTTQCPLNKGLSANCPSGYTLKSIGTYVISTYDIQGINATATSYACFKN